MTDQELWLQMMAANSLLSESDLTKEQGERIEADISRLGVEIDNRFGPEASEHVAQWATACHMTGDECIAWVTDSWPHFQSVMTGEIK